MRVNIKDAEVEIANRRAFNEKNGVSLWATKVSESTCGVTTGQLPVDVAKELNAKILANRVDYVVYSYRTPIAWTVDGELFVPSIQYSNTTSRHQGIARRAA